MGNKNQKDTTKALRRKTEFKYWARLLVETEREI